MENYDRLVEVQEGAMNSEDAGLVQYAKTLDSLDTKLTQLSNNFQTFYMSIFNGDFFKGAVGILNTVITNVSRLGTVMGTISVIKIINQIKLVGQLLLNLMSPAITKWKTQIDRARQDFTQGWDTVGDETGNKLYQAIRKWLEKIGVQFREEITENANEAQRQVENGGNTGSGRQTRRNIGRGLTTIGTVAQTVGLGIDTSTESGYQLSNWMQIGGGALSAIGQAATSNYVGAAISAVTTIAQGISYCSNYSQVMYENAKKAAEEANIERATKQSEARGLESTINNLKKLQKAQYDSEEAQQAYIDACNTAAESYPELVSSYITNGDALIDVIHDTTAAEALLTKTRKDASNAAIKAAEAELAKFAREKKEENWDDTTERYERAQQVGGAEIVYDDNQRRYVLRDAGGASTIYGRGTLEYETLKYFLPDSPYEITSGGGSLEERLIAAFYDEIADIKKFFGKEMLTKSDLDTNMYGTLSRGLPQLLADLGFLLFEDDGTIKSQEAVKEQIEDTRTTAREESIDAYTYAKSQLSQESGYQRAVINSYMTDAILNLNAGSEADWQSLIGLESIYDDAVELDNEYYKWEGDVLTLTEDGKALISQKARELDSAAKDLYNTLGLTGRDKFSSAVEEYEKGIITLGELKDRTFSTGIESNAAYTAMMEKYQENNEAALQRIREGLVESEKILPDNEGKEDFSWDNISQDYDNIANLPLLYAEQLANEIHDINDILADEAIPEGQRAVAAARKQLLTEFDFADIIPSELSGEFFSLLFSDFGTHDWAEALKQFLEENKIDTEGLIEQIEASEYENIVTRIQSLTDQLSEFVETRKDYQSKQESGWEFNAARTFFNEAKKLGIATNFEELFSYDETGKLILSNFSDTMSAYYNGMKESLDKLRGQQSKAITNLSSTSEVGSENQLRMLLDQWGITETSLVDEIIKAFNNNTLQEYLEDLIAQEKLTAQQIEFINKQIAIADRENKFSEHFKPKSIASDFKSLLSASDFSDLESLYTSYGGEQSPDEFFASMAGANINEFGDLVITNIEEYANWIKDRIRDIHPEIDSLDIEPIIQDAILSVVKAVGDDISAAIEGTLSAENFQKMAKAVDNEAFTNAFTLTSTGYKANKNDFGTVSQVFVKYGQQNGLSAYNVANQMAEWMTDTYDIADAYDVITEAEKNASGELQQILALTRNILKETASTREFDFMNVDALGGAADNLDKITSSMDSAISALQTAMSGDGKINYKQFESMFNWMRDFGGEDLEQKLFGVANGFEQFHAAAAKTIDYAGNINIGEALENMNIGFGDFSDSLGETFKQIASEQADYWEGQAKFFDRLAQLEAATGESQITIPAPTFETSNPAEAELQQYGAELQTSIDDQFGIEGITAKIFPDIDFSNFTAENITTIQEFFNALNSGDKDALSQVTNAATSLGALDESMAALAGIETDKLEEQATDVEGIGEAASGAAESVNALNGALDTLADKQNIFKTITVSINTKSSGVLGTVGSVIANAAASLFGNGSAAASGGIVPGGRTLVGELGPELGVYDGMYHLLGQNGAEFVDLPSQALVFNHAQTEALLRGKSGVRIKGAAMASGNISGPAFAGGYAAAAQKAREIAELWRGMADSTVTDLLGSAGGGGGGGGEDTIKATAEELEEWYNLSRQIANVEQEINNLVAERENIAEGDKYLRSLREQQVLLKEQQQLQKTLLNYQQLQLKRQADLINQNKLWSQFLTVTDEGLLQYIQGNETNGGKGALKVLQELNDMSGADQVAFLDKIGYSYTTQDGEELEGAELVQQFFNDLQSEIDKYDELYDTVHETKETLEELESDVTEINEEIRENQMDLEKEIFDILVDAWEEQIEQMKEQNELVKQANQDYVDGLNNALTKERELYSQNESVAERESLQRRLSLLRRSGGSATEIASLEDQIDSMLKDEYFNSQEDMIQNIEEANDRQVQLLEQQVQLQQDALDFEKENGVLWTKVYEIMNGSSDEILKFMQGKYVDFFAQSMLQQEEMLTDWAFKIGIYTEDRAYTNYEARARDIFAGSLSADQTKVYNRLAADKQTEAQDLFNSTFANARLQGMDEDAAVAEALKAIRELLPSQQQTTSNNGNAPMPGNTDTGSAAVGKTRYVYMTGEQETAKNGFEVGASRRVGINTDSSDENIVRNSIKALARKMGVKLTGSKLHGFSTGGLVDYTGLAMVHGSSSKPEAFLNAEQTAQIREALTEQGRGSVLRNVLSTLQDIGHSVASLVSNTISSITIAPGAIVINVDELNDAYDINDVSNDIMARITNIASKATNTGVSRR